MRRSMPITLLILVLAQAGCATPPNDPEARAEFDETNDPAEPTNRAVFDANSFVDNHALRPVATAYRDHVPEPVQRGLHNFLGNLGEPITGLNHALEGNTDLAWMTLQRFTVNTLVGGVGLFDVATAWDLPHRDADFG